MRFCLILLLLVSLQAAHAQEALSQPSAPPPVESAPPLVRAPGEPEPPPPSQVLAEGPPLELKRGARVRVEMTEGQRHIGELVSLRPGALSLEASPQQVVNLLLIDVHRLDLRTRAPGHGALVGAGVGGLSGGLFLSLLCIVASEGDDSTILPCAGIGALIGAALGAGVGALVGLAVPRWSTVYEKGAQGALSLRLSEPEDAVLAHWFSGKDAVGEVGFQGGYARDMGISQPTEGWGGRLHLLALLGPYLAVGPEVAWYSNIGTQTIVPPSGFKIQEEHSLFQLGGLVRGGLEIGPTRTSVLLGVGLHSNRTSRFGGSAGGEVEVRLWERLPPLAVEVRYHFPIQKTGPVERFLTFGLGTRVWW